METALLNETPKTNTVNKSQPEKNDGANASFFLPKDPKTQTGTEPFFAPANKAVPQNNTATANNNAATDTAPETVEAAKTDITPEADIKKETDTNEPQETADLKYLDPTTTEAALKARLAATNTLATENAKTKPASVKVNESVKAQNTPASEAQATSNEGQVKQLSQKQVPQKKKETAKKALDTAIEQSIPTTLKQVDEFKKDKKAAAISRAVIGQVKRDVGDVKSGFSSIGSKPKPAAAVKGATLPGAEPAKTVNRLNLAAGILPAIKKEALETADYTKQADDLLTKEGITQQQLDMVDKGDLAQANLAKKGLDEDIRSQPAEVQGAAAKEHSALNSKMNEIETSSRSEMHTHREQQLKKTGGQQAKAKTDLEKKRDEVARTINERYTGCQTSINNKLNDLEKTSMRAFDQGQELATTAFEYQVNRDINAFKSRRYTADLQGAYYWTRDWFKGIDNFPEVQKAFSTAKAAYVSRIDSLIETITQKNNEVIAACKAELEATKKQIADYVKSLDPALKEIGRKTQREVNEKLQELGRQIEERKEKLQQLLVEKRKSAMEAIDKKIADMKKKMGGALDAFGKLLLDAAKKFFKWALETLGIDAEGFMKTLEKAGQAIALIFKDPGKFFSNLVAAVRGSIDNFRENFKAYLSEGLFDWLTGALGSIITLPKVWDIQGIFSVILQLAGISWAFIRKKLVDLFGEEKIAYAEETVDVVKKFVTDGVVGLWEWIKDQAETIKTTVVEGIKDWLLTRMVVGFTEWIASLLIPGGAIVRLIEGIYKLVMFFVDNMQRIILWVNSILDSLVSIASGAIAGAITAIVSAMKVIIPTILDFFAKLLNISGIVDAIQEVIAKITAPIHKAIDKFIEFLKGLLDKVLKKFKGNKKAKNSDEAEDETVKAKANNKVDDTEIGETIRFTADKEQHRLWINVNGNNVEAMVASIPMPVSEKLKEWRNQANGNVEKLDLIQQAEKENTNLSERSKAAELALEAYQNDEADESKGETLKKLDASVRRNETKLGNILQKLFKAFNETTKDILLVGRHKIIVPGSEDRESHHVPQNELKNTFSNYYRNLGLKLEAAGAVEIAKKLEARAKAIDTKFPKGNGLSAISLHRGSHTAAETGVHSAAMQKGIEDEITNQTKEGEMTVLLKLKDGRSLEAKVNKANFEQYIAIIYAIEDKIEDEVKKLAGKGYENTINIDKTSKGIVIKINATEVRSIAKLTDDVQKDFVNAIKHNRFGGDNIANNSLNKLKTKIDNTANLSFENMLKVSIEAVRFVLNKNEKLDGDKNLFDSRLAELRELARSIWKDIIQPL